MALARVGLAAPLPFPWALRSWNVRRFGGGGGSDVGGGRRGAPSSLYELLGVSANATQTQIKTAYYKQSFIFHPDRNAGSEEAAERFTRINEAYLVLGSVALRKRYDRGILSHQDLRTAGKPSGKEAASRPPPRRTQSYTASPSSRYSPTKPIFDFDKFYREHYVEQLERERFIREMRQERKKLKENKRWWKPDSLTDILAFLILFSGVALLTSGR